MGFLFRLMQPLSRSRVRGSHLFPGMSCRVDLDRRHRACSFAPFILTMPTVISNKGVHSSGHERLFPFVVTLPWSFLIVVCNSHHSHSVFICSRNVRRPATSSKLTKRRVIVPTLPSISILNVQSPAHPEDVVEHIRGLCLLYSLGS